MKVISTKKAPTAIGPYSQAIQVGNLVYTSGQIPIDPALSSHYGRNRFYHAHPKVFVSYRGGRHEHFSHR